MITGAVLDAVTRQYILGSILLVLLLFILYRRRQANRKRASSN